jgi:cellulose synthase (UDP-forming)
LAWVQSPQWFYDIPAGKSLKEVLQKRLGAFGRALGKVIPFASRIKLDANIFGTDPNIFYDAILRSRNASNASFCCGAGSIHRRKALEKLILSKTQRLIELGSTVAIDKSRIRNQELYASLPTKYVVGPFVHHISEDIYTSILLHAEKDEWRSYQHPRAECKMLSPQTLSGYVKQYSRYAEGTFELFFSKENPLWLKGLSIKQRLAYFETIYSYFSPFWIIILLASPAIFFFTLTPPLKAFNFDFFLRFLIFYHLNLVVTTLANWGHGTKRSEQYFLSSFWYKLKAFFKILSGGKVTFNTTSKTIKQERLFQNLRHIYPHLIITLVTIAGFLWNLVLISNNTHPSYSAFMVNSLWGFYNIYQLNPIMRAALRKPKEHE